MLALGCLTTAATKFKRQLLVYVTGSVPQVCQMNHQLSFQEVRSQITQNLVNIEAHRATIVNIKHYTKEDDIDAYLLYLKDLVAINKNFPQPGNDVVTFC